MPVLLVEVPADPRQNVEPTAGIVLSNILHALVIVGSVSGDEAQVQQGDPSIRITEPATPQPRPPALEAKVPSIAS